MKTKLFAAILSNTAIALFVLGITYVVTRTDREVYKEGKELLKTGTIEETIEHFDKHVTETGSPSSLFGIAWAEWIRGNFIEAETICNFILDEDLPEEKVRANCFYLRGLIYSQQGRHEDSFQNFTRALEIYKQLGESKNLFNTFLGMAEMFINARDIENAENFLAEAQNIYPATGGKSLAYYYLLQTNLAFFRRDYQAALGNSWKAYEEYELEGNENGKTNALIYVSLYLMLTGELDKGLAKTLEVAERIKGSGDENKKFYNDVNFVLAYRCRGLDYADLEQGIRDCIERDDDQLLKENLEFALVWECNQ